MEQGEGRKAKEGFWATINYKVYLLEGTECYSSDNDGPKTFQIGRGGVEAGLEEGILLLNEGARAKFIMPPHLAHGLPGDGHKIPARAIIIYEVELVRLSKQ
jgi:FKBP-type peptidyl-prolyl cis-trans isomerase